MKFILIYHSGVGNSKMIASKIVEQLKMFHEVDLYSVEQLPDIITYEKYDGVIIGFPTIHTHPTKRILDFLDCFEPLEISLPIYIFTTFGMYSANTLRIFAKKCVPKKLVPILCKSYRCAATDGVLLVPSIKIFGKHEKNLYKKISIHCVEFIDKIEKGNCKVTIPRFKLYSILNFPNKLVGQWITFPIYLHKQKCINCGKCIENCPTKALTKDKEGYPRFEKNKCVKCYRCIHNCPMKALSLSKKRITKVTLDHEYYRQYTK